MKTIHSRQIQLTKMRIRKTKNVLYIVSNIFPTILHTRIYPSPHTFLPHSHKFLLQSHSFLPQSHNFLPQSHTFLPQL